MPLPVDGSAPQPITPIVDGFACRECPYKTRDRSNIRKHANRTHNKNRVADEDICQVVRLQSWFGEKREQYWVVDESQLAGSVEDCTTSSDDDRSSDSLADDQSRTGTDANANATATASTQLIQDIEQWEAEAADRRLHVQTQPSADELDPWLCYTGWNAVLERSKHNLVETYTFVRMPDANEVGLDRVLLAWDRVLNRCLDMLAAADQKDTLKW